MPVPDVAISIVNHENRELVRACLLSLPAACEGVAWHATVIDNVSADGSLEMLASQFPDVTVVANHHRLGFGANHNQLLRPAIAAPSKGPRYILILNDDTTLQPRAVTKMAQMLDGDPTLAAVVPTIVDTTGRAVASRIAYPSARSAWRCDWTDRVERPDPDHGFLQGCCLLVRVSAIAQVGPFDERFFLFYEDTDLSRRLCDAGWSLGRCPDAVVIHVGHASVLGPGMAATTPRQGRRSRYLYFCKYQGRVRAELITGVGRTLLLVRAAKATAGRFVGPDADPSRAPRARRLFAMARQNPRIPVPPDPRAPVPPTSASAVPSPRTQNPTPGQNRR